MLLFAKSKLFKTSFVLLIVASLIYYLVPNM